jgi:isopenicillin N synthase-like dioxygenase
MSIPVVDLSTFTNGSESDRKAFVYELGRAYEDVGFVAVKNHGIPDELIEELYRYVKEFFGLPLPIKKDYEKPELAGQRGYTSFGKEHAKGSTAPDLKEFYQYGQTVEDNDPVAAEYPANVAVNEVPQLTPTLFRAYRHFEKSGRSLLKAIALYLGLDENYFKGNSLPPHHA